jgi:hypothetical protein
MGSYAHLEVAGYPFFSMKSYVDDTLMTLFDEVDKRVFKRKVCERNQRAWCVDDSDTDEETAYQYSLDAEHARQRLDILGFTFTKAKQAFESRLQEYRREVNEGGIISGLWWIPDDRVADFLATYSFAEWVSTIQQFITSSFTRPLDRQDQEKLDPMMRLTCSDDSDDFFFGFPICDPRLFIRAVLEVTGTTDPVVLDCSELVNNGYYASDKPLASMAKISITDEFTATAKIVVLTEGSSDSEFLQHSLAILYPHLVPLYSFIDFLQPNMEGGAASLVRVIKAFVAGGIVNKVIALFDNDTSASIALRSLQGITLPRNIAIIRCPPVQYAENYPTIGPQGNVSANVNGLAGSIELYFGLDVLRQRNGSLSPVQWRGFDQTIGQYQGELMNKSELQRAFREKLKTYAVSPAISSSADWLGMKLILESIFTAFDPATRKGPTNTSSLR